MIKQKKDNLRPLGNPPPPELLLGDLRRIFEVEVLSSLALS